MKKKDLITEVSKKTGYSESHIIKVLGGYRHNDEILACAAKIKKENEPGNPVPKLSMKFRQAPIKPTFSETNHTCVKKNIPASVCDLFKRIREIKGFSQEQLAIKVGLSINEVDDTERGISSQPAIVFCRWMDVCGVIIGVKL